MRFENGYALLIGVGRHRDPDYSLPTTVKDVLALEQILRNPELCAYAASNIRVLHDDKATAKAIREGLEWLKTCAQRDKRATIIFYFSGHGGRNTASGSYFLMPHDGMDTRNMLTTEDLSAALQAIPAQRLLVLLDCCHAGGMTKAGPGGSPEERQWTKAAPSPNVLAALKQGSGRVVISSARDAQKSYIRSDNQLSIFTYHLLEALQGAGNLPFSKEVTVANLMSYVSAKVTASALEQHMQDQTPFIQQAAEDFPVALIRAGSGFGKGGWEYAAADAHAAIEAAAKAAVSISHSNVAIGNTVGRDLNQNQQSSGVNAAGATFGDGAIIGGRDVNQTYQSGGINFGDAKIGRIGSVTGGDSYGGDRVEGNKIDGSVKISGGTVNINYSPSGPSQKSRPQDAEVIRLDVATPSKATVNELFEIAVAIRQPDAPALHVADLPQVASSQGEIYRTEAEEVVKYRVEVDAPDCDVRPQSYLFGLQKGKNSPVQYFRIVAKRAGRICITVNAYQEDDLLAASERVFVQADIVVAADYQLRIECDTELTSQQENEIIVHVSGTKPGERYRLELRAPGISEVRKVQSAAHVVFYITPTSQGALNLSVVLYDLSDDSQIAQIRHTVHVA